MIFRADGNEQIGLGHIMRSLALAEMLQDSFECEFVTSSPTVFVKDAIQGLGLNLIELPHISAKSLTDVEKSFEVPFDMEGMLGGVSMVVLDGYHFGKNYQLSIRKAGCKLVNIDDAIGVPCYGDFIINHGFDSNWDYYQSLEGIQEVQQVRCGINYVLIRKLFFERSTTGEKKYDALIILGGSEQQQLVNKIVTDFRKGEDSLSVAVIGGYKQKPESDEIEFFVGLSPQEVKEMMNVSELIICPASTASLEVYAGGYRFMVGYLADNQISNYKGLLKRGIEGIGDFNSVKDWYQVVSAARTRLRNTENPEIPPLHYAGKRIVHLFKALHSFGSIPRFRSVSMEDAQDLFNWRNDPGTRKNSITQDEVLWEGHIQWLEKMISRADVAFKMVMIGKEKVGTFRLDKEGDKYFINFTVAPQHRGRGIGFLIIDLIESMVQEAQWLMENQVQIMALVAPHNIPSKLIFEGAGFSGIEDVKIDNYTFLQFQKQVWKA